MANLVPLYIDKSTGELVATGDVIASGGGGGGAGIANGYLHVQNIANDLWVIDHGQGTENVLVQVYSGADQFFLPDAITIVDLDTIEIEFSAPVAGRAHVIFFQPV